MQAPDILGRREQNDDLDSAEIQLSNDLASTRQEETRPRASVAPESENRESRESSCSSSAMDESMDSMEDLLNDQPMPEEATYTPADSVQDGIPEIPERRPSIPVDTEDSQPSSISVSPKPDEVGEDSGDRRETSVVSDAYEPPEPDARVGQEDNTPPFSPAPPETEGKMDIEPRPSHVPQATETLTLHSQDPITTAVPEDNAKV